MNWVDIEANIGNELYYLTTDNLPNDLTDCVPPQGTLIHTKVIRASDGQGSKITRQVVIDGKTTATQLVFETVEEAYTGLAALYNQLRQDGLAEAQKYANLRDAALVLVGGQ